MAFNRRIMLPAQRQVQGGARNAISYQYQLSRFSPSRSYTLRNSSDLRAWANLSTFVPTAGTNSIPLANLGQAPSFYRLCLEN
jgi:hypothetical protein